MKTNEQIQVLLKIGQNFHIYQMRKKNGDKTKLLGGLFIFHINFAMVYRWQSTIYFYIFYDTQSYLSEVVAAIQCHGYYQISNFSVLLRERFVVEKK